MTIEVTLRCDFHWKENDGFLQCDEPGICCQTLDNTIIDMKNAWEGAREDAVKQGWRTEKGQWLCRRHRDEEARTKTEMWEFLSPGITKRLKKGTTS